MAVRPTDHAGGRVQRADEQAGGRLLLLVCGVGDRDGEWRAREGVSAGPRGNAALCAAHGAEREDGGTARQTGHERRPVPHHVLSVRTQSPGRSAGGRTAAWDSGHRERSIVCLGSKRGRHRNASNTLAGIAVITKT